MMIAKARIRGDAHYDEETLRRLLEGELSISDSREVEGHLGQCSHCQKMLEEVAGAVSWWNEVSDALRKTAPQLMESLGTEPQESFAASAGSSDSRLAWLQPILKPSEPDTYGVCLGKLDQYLVRGVIGQGGMGVVFRCEDTVLNRPIAMKVLAPHLAGVGAARSRFMREAKAAAAIVHPSIVPIYSIATSATQPYLVMPLIAGGNLQERVEREGPLSLEEVLRIGVQVAEGLIAAHRRGVIHRDIKPSNVLIEKGNGRVLISDFGLARALDDATITNSGMIAGTPSYMSPEQARGENATRASDWFSFGGLIYTLATGRPPYRAESPLAVLRKIMDTTPPPAHHIHESLPPWLSRLIAKLMEPSVQDRLQGEHALKLLQAAHLHLVNPGEHSLPQSLVMNQRGNQRRAQSLLVVAVLFLLMGGLGWFFFVSQNFQSPGAKHSPTQVDREPLGKQLTDSTSTGEDAGLPWNTPPIPLPPDPAHVWIDASLESDLEKLEQALNQLEPRKLPGNLFEPPFSP